VAFRCRGTPGGRRRTRSAFDRWLVDVRHCWRGLRARPGASIGTVVVLTVGIGLTTIIFALTDPFLLRPLPYPDPEHLVVLKIEPASGVSISERFSRDITSDVPSLIDWQRRTDLFQEVTAYGSTDRVRLATPQGATTIAVTSVSPNFLSMLGFRGPVVSQAPPTGPEAPRRLIVSATTSRGRLGLEERQVPTTLRAEGGTFVDVVSTLPEEFLFPSASLFLRPDAVSPVDVGPVVRRASPGTIDMVTGIARVQPGVGPVAVKSALDGGLSASGYQVIVTRLDRHLTDAMRPLALGAFGAGLLIAIVCTANVMNLLVARGLYRARDFATCHALGASRLDLLRLVLLELAAIGVGAAASGLCVAQVGLAAIAQVMPAEYGVLGQPGITHRVVIFTIGLTGAIVLACAIPAWLSARSIASASISRARHDQSRTVRRWRFLLAAGQTMIAMTLLVGAALLARSYANLWLQTTGYAPEARLVAVSYPASRTSSEFVETINATIEVLRRVPGISDAAAGVAVGPLLDGYGGGGGPTIRAGRSTFMMMPSEVTDRYFQVVGTTMLAGRAIESTDRGWDAVVVNRAFARHFWPTITLDEVVGQPISGNGQSGRVVGVAEDAHSWALDVRPTPRLYKALGSWSGSRRLSFAIRLAADGSVPETAIRRAVIAIDGDAVVETVDSVYGRLAESVRDRTFATLILGLFAAAGLGITATGICAVVAFVAARRTREIAIRVALGAKPRDIRRLVGREAVLATFAGGVAGLVASRWLAKAIESQLYGVTAGDWMTPAFAVAGLVAITAVAAWWPTRRALAVQPTVALRIE
jgi:predicted permease